MRHHLLAAVAALSVSAALAGCDKARTVPQEATAQAPTSGCTGCHGGLQNQTGAPPRDTAGRTSSATPSVGAHTKHVDAGYDCDACHVKPGRVREPGHLDGTAGITFGAAARQPDGSPAPAYDRTTHTCSNVYCHGAKLPAADQGQATAPVWTASPLTGAPCASCHGSAGSAGAPPAPHPGGLASPADCNVCHPGTVDAGGAIIPAAQGGLHINGQKDIAEGACNACHGDASGSRGDAGAAVYAPPVDTSGATSGAKVGAHLRHVSTVTSLGSRLSQPFPCTECHVVPTTTPHNPPGGVVQFGTAAPPARNVSTTGGLAPTYVGGSCATTYCHGGSLGAGGSNHAPGWNAPGAAACGTCHFQAASVATAAGHPQVDTSGAAFTTNAQCNQCHPATVDAGGAIIIGLGNHVNGSLEATSPHPATWVASTEHGPAAKRDLASCQPCHGATFGTDLGGGKSCNTCHANPATFIPGYTGATHPAWQTECTFCHGDTNRAAVAGLDPAGTPPVNSAKIVPPVDTEKRTAATDVAVGAHLRHVSNNLFSAPYKCDQCHGLNVLGDTPHQGVGHVDTRVTIGWQLAALGSTPVITPPLTAGSIPAARTTTGAPRGSSVSCANYCHGATMAGGANTTVTWNVPGTVNCDSCHSQPPTYAAPSWHTAGANAASCATCHPYSAPTSAANRALHVDGTVELNASVACNSCHGSATNAAPPGAASSSASASTDPRVGAHQPHLAAGGLARAFLCTDCHGTLPPAMNHANGAVTLTWSTLASAGAVTPSPATGDKTPGSTSTCANYCHGGKWAPPGTTNDQYRGTLTSPGWTAGPSQAACGTCHKVAPTSSAHASVGTATSCSTCHTGYACTSGNLAACTVNLTTHVNGVLDAPNMTCSSCHGTAGRTAIAGTFGPAPSANNLVGMPPIDTASATAGVRVGGHVSHSTPAPATQVITAVACSECHGNAVNSYTTSHPNSTSDVTFANATKANLGGVTPSIVQGAGTTPDTCTTYCHGAALTAAQRGSVATWTWTTATNATCGSCHASPPADAAHTSVAKPSPATACNPCHATVVNAAGGIIFNGTGASATTLHINGARQTSATCTSCHGSGVNAAPPLATSGASATTNPKVGAHQKHLIGTTLRTGALACDNCHAVPTAQNHATGAVNVAWNTLASASAVTPAPATGVVPAAWETAPTCTNYCHGGKWAANAAYRGATTSVSWTGTAADAQCNDCHQAPPASSAHGSVTTAINCNTCHTGYDCTSGNLAGCTVNKTVHINSTAEANLTCASCHGTAGRTAIAGTFGPAQSASNLAGMPPVDTAAATAGVRVGAHVSHSTPAPATQVITAVACSECHGNAVNGYTMSHPNSTSDVTFVNATRANLGGVTASIVQGAGTTPDTCTTYCHGASLTAAQRGSQPTWTWTTATNATCGSCHGAPPNDPVHTSVAKPAAATACNPCHATTVNTSGGIIFNGTGTSATTLHVNGLRQATTTCRSCHGNATNFAPPLATSGSTATTNPKVGAHQKHLTGTTLRTGALACDNCHAVPAAQNHATGAVDVAWNTLASASAVTPTPAAGTIPTPWVTAPNCTNYCHGGKWAANASYRGATTSVSWTGTAADAQCNDCHQAPPASGSHASVGTATNCNTCHTGYDCTSGNLAGCTVNKTVHINSATDANLTCASCHGTAGRTAIAGTFGPAPSANNLVGMPPVDTASATAGVRVGGHVSHATPTPASQVIRAVACSECHGNAVNGYTTAHPNSTSDVTFANATQANLGGVTPTIVQGAGTTPDTCTTYCHGASLTAAQKGAITTWTWTTATSANCGSCHGSAPNDAAHTSVSKSAAATACNPCHATTVNTSGGIIFNGTGTSATTLHVNGVRQATTTCRSCHGSATNFAPPLATSGSTATTNPKVGAHQKHLTGTTLRTGALACDNCHAVPSAQNHATGAVNVAWNTLASVGFTPTPAAGAVAPAWETAPTCTNYCHGGKWAASAQYRGATTSVSWTGTAADAQCNDCHQAPPVSGAHGSVTTATNCSTCHDGYDCTSGNLAGCSVNKAVHLNGVGVVLSDGCASCHGTVGRTAIAGTFGPAQSANNLVGMPPVDTASATAGVRVGGHVSHATPTPASQVIRAVACSECHGNAVNAYTLSHPNAASDVTFANATQANLGGVTPTIVQGAGTTPDTCTTYCHGASLTAAQRGAITTWTWTTATSANCGSCHGSAPNDAAHTSVSKSAAATACNPCHATTVNTSGGIIFNGTGTSATTLHVNGIRQATTTCRSCHGGAVNFAPPLATSGSTATTNPKVGAHQKHLTGTTLRTGALACDNCHALPSAQNHATGAVNVAWNTLASASAVVPAPAAGTVAPAWETAPTCTNYCHGGKWAANASYRGATTSVSWTGTAADAQCNDCHQAPPASGGHSSVGTATNCSTCHTGYACTSGNLAGCTVNKSTHLNGAADVSLACSSCHGTAGRTPIAGTFGPAQSANNLVGMPPVDTASATAGVRVGGHVSHATPTPATQVITAVACSECHGTAVNSYTSGHSNSTSDVTFANATKANLGGVTPSIVQGAGTTPDTCTTYCHGASLTAAQKGAITTWTWTTATSANCGSCHGSAPNDAVHTSVSKSAAATACNPCHNTTVNTSGGIIFNGTGTSATTLHVNGVRQATTTCRSCHGGAANFAPPVATSGSTATTNPKVGAHQKHLTGTTLRTGALACDNCHALPAAQNHATGAVNVAWNTLASVGFTPTPAAGTVAPAWETAPTCTNYCHGGKWAANATYRGATTSVSWTGTPADAQCNDCHQAPPASAGHGSVGTATNCSSCHTGYACTSGNLAGCTVNKTVHLNGTFDVPPASNCVGCHTGTQGARRAIVPEFALAWSHKRSATPAGTVTKFDCVVCHMEGNLTTGDPDPAFHPMTANGNINLRDPDTGVEILNVTYTNGTGASAGSYANGAGSPVFTDFSRNMGSTTIEPVVQAIMINQCLKCHDSNGAQAAWVRGPTAGSSAKPFNTTIAGATYTGIMTAGGVLGGVTDVKTSFATTNSSYHPILGQQNNSYVSALRMNAPWTTITKTGGNTTTWGYRLSCWDCHAPQGATGVQTATVTAHGGAVTLRQTYWAVNATNLCTTCHRVVPVTGSSTSTHGQGSAWSTTGNGTPGGIARTSCFRCHGSNNAAARPPRPYAAQDVHGFNAFSPATGTDTLWPVGATNTYRPYGFMRSAGTSGLWNGTISWKPLSGPGVGTGNATCGSGTLNGCSNQNHGTYTPGGVY